TFTVTPDGLNPLLTLESVAIAEQLSLPDPTAPENLLIYIARVTLGLELASNGSVPAAISSALLAPSLSWSQSSLLRMPSPSKSSLGPFPPINGGVPPPPS